MVFIACPPSTVPTSPRVVYPDGRSLMGPWGWNQAFSCACVAREPTSVPETLNPLLSIQVHLRPACRTSFPCTARCNTPKPSHYDDVSGTITLPVGIPTDCNSRAAPDNYFFNLWHVSLLNITSTMQHGKKENRVSAVESPSLAGAGLDRGQDLVSCH